MKKIYIFNLLLVILFAACAEREKITIGETVNPTLSSSVSGSDIVINADEIDNNFDTFNWTEAGFGFQSANAEYTLWMDTAGNNFATAVSLGKTKELELAVTYKKINTILLTMGVKPGETQDVVFKLTGTIHPDYNCESNVVTVNVTPVKVIIVYPKLYVTGDQNGWAFDDEDVIFSIKSDNKYEGYVYLSRDPGWPRFKLSSVPNWNSADPIIGDANASGVSGTLHLGDWGLNDIYASLGTGYYRLKADMNNLTYSLDLTSWGISGDFNAWGNTAMTYDEATDTWSYTGNITAGAFKFIANGAWNIYYGGSAEAGILENPGSNIAIAQDGNYTITLDLGDAIYTYSVVKN